MEKSLINQWAEEYEAKYLFLVVNRKVAKFMVEKALSYVMERAEQKAFVNVITLSDLKSIIEGMG